MAPLRPPTSRSSSHSHYFDPSDDLSAQQAGRSSTNIAAQASAQSLREASRPISRPQSRPATPNSTQKTRPPPLTTVAGLGSRSATPRPPTSATSSPLYATPSPSVHSPENQENGAEGESTLNASSTTSLSPARPATADGRRPIAATLPSSGAQTPNSRVPLLANPMRSQIDPSPWLTRQTTPRSVRDLGSDYTRYFNPFATRNSSQQDLATPLPRSGSSAHSTPGAPGVSSADLHNRLSNPFVDTRRLSNPFHSRTTTAPGTPLPKRNRPDERHASDGEKKAMATSTIRTREFVEIADPEKVGFYPYLDDRLCAPEYGFPLFSDVKEDDDDLHMPQWDDDIRLKPKFRDHFTRENLVSTLGLVFVVLGLSCVFIVLPVVSFTGTGLIDYTYDTPLDQIPNPDAAQPWATVNDRLYPLMQNMRSGLIDPDTPSSARSRQGVDGDTYKLVFSDEFNQRNRTFYPGDDPYWYGFDGWYGATQDLEWYDPDAINTGDGTLQLQLDAFANHGLGYRSGMLHSWNQLCFKGGIFEVSMSLPGPAGVHGWWPGVWTMGNLGRPGYLATTDGLWPYTYDDCDSGITPNQSMTDGTSNLPGQRLPSCPCAGEDHPSPGTGRGAPEIDIAEVSGDWGGHGWGVATQSFQVAPFDIWYYPNYEFMETPNYNLSFVNTYTGGPYQQAVSTTSVLNNAWYDGNEYQKFAYEYTPGGDPDSGIAWIIGEEEMMRFDARAIGPNGNIGQRLVSEEPMSMILNLGFSHSWVDIDFAALKFPTVMRIDYVRWYQKEDDDTQVVTCDPPGYETTSYIANHPAAYNNPNFTHWVDAGYDWPRNTLMNGCTA